jgi:hypothetical protein
LNENLLMLKSRSLESSLKLVSACARGRILWVLIATLALLPAASAQANFTLTMTPFSPYAVNPGGTSSASITLSALNGFNGTVDLTCQVTPQPTGYSDSDCQLSPVSVTPPADATVTVTTPAWPAALYTITITGTATVSGTPYSESAQQNLTVLAVSPDFTITVTKVVAPSSVHAGSGGWGTISVNPINGYTVPSGGVTLSCASITPLVTIPPVCSFNPNPVMPGENLTSTLTISTTGPTTTGAVAHAQRWYALWLPLPLLALAGLGARSRKRLRRACCLLVLLVAAGALLLTPACSSSSTTTTSTTGVTPNNTYTFTLMGVDANGVTSSNTGTNTAPTVTLTVD